VEEDGMDIDVTIIDPPVKYLSQVPPAQPFTYPPDVAEALSPNMIVVQDVNVDVWSLPKASLADLDKGPGVKITPNGRVLWRRYPVKPRQLALRSVVCDGVHISLFPGLGPYASVLIEEDAFCRVSHYIQGIVLLMRFAETCRGRNPRCQNISSSHGEITEGDDLADRLQLNLRTGAVLNPTFARAARSGVVWKNLVLPVDTRLGQELIDSFGPSVGPYMRLYFFTPLTSLRLIDLRTAALDFVFLLKSSSAPSVQVLAIIRALLVISGIETNPGPSALFYMLGTLCLVFLACDFYLNRSVLVAVPFNSSGSEPEIEKDGGSFTLSYVAFFYLPLEWIEWLRIDLWPSLFLFVEVMVLFLFGYIFIRFGPGPISSLLIFVRHVVLSFVLPVQALYAFVRGFLYFGRLILWNSLMVYGSAIRLYVAIACPILGLMYLYVCGYDAYQLIRLLLFMAGIEPNPGPPKQDPAKRDPPKRKGPHSRESSRSEKNRKIYRPVDLRASSSSSEPEPKVGSVYQMSEKHLAELAERCVDRARALEGADAPVVAALVPLSDPLEQFLYWFVPTYNGLNVATECLVLPSTLIPPNKPVVDWLKWLCSSWRWLLLFALVPCLYFFLTYFRWPYIFCFLFMVSAAGFAVVGPVRVVFRRRLRLEYDAPFRVSEERRDVPSRSQDVMVDVDYPSTATMTVTMHLFCLLGNFKLRGTWRDLVHWMWFHRAYARWEKVSVGYSHELVVNCIDSVHKIADMPEDHIVARVDMITSAVRPKIALDRDSSFSDFILPASRAVLLHYARSARSYSSVLFRPGLAGQVLASGW